jgi:hypothetical protein
MAYVVAGGLFEPGTAVSLYELESEAVLRVESHTLVGRRLADKAGTVGFDGLDEGKRYTQRRTAPADGDTRDRSRFPTPKPAAVTPRDTRKLQRAPGKQGQPVGTQEQVVPSTAPVGAPDAILHTGVPAGVPLGVTTS